MTEKTFRDELAMSMSEENIRFPTLRDMATFVGREEVPTEAGELFAMSFDALAKLRYMYADAMLKARGSEAERVKEVVVDAEGWIPYKGKENPAIPDSYVDIKLQNESIQMRGKSKYWDWDIEGGPTDIAFWRYSK